MNEFISDFKQWVSDMVDNPEIIGSELANVGGKIVRGVASVAGGAVVGIGLMLCGCGNDVSSGGGRQDVLQYVSQDGNYRVIGPVWDCSRQIDGEWYFPILISEKGKDGCVRWCREVSRGSSGNFDVVAKDGSFYLSDCSFCCSDEMKVITYMDFVSGSTTNWVALDRVAP